MKHIERNGAPDINRIPIESILNYNLLYLQYYIYNNMDFSKIFGNVAFKNVEYNFKVR